MRGGPWREEAKRKWRGGGGVREGKIREELRLDDQGTYCTAS